jgi:hypothetical protein
MRHHRSNEDLAKLLGAASLPKTTQSTQTVTIKGRNNSTLPGMQAQQWIETLCEPVRALAVARRASAKMSECSILHEQMVSAAE